MEMDGNLFSSVQKPRCGSRPGKQGRFGLASFQEKDLKSKRRDKIVELKYGESSKEPKHVGPSVRRNSRKTNMTLRGSDFEIEAREATNPLLQHQGGKLSRNRKVSRGLFGKDIWRNLSPSSPDAVASLVAQTPAQWS